MGIGVPPLAATTATHPRAVSMHDAVTETGETIVDY